jgi:hypothetical protein
MIRRLISHIAFRYNRICYQAGYNDGYGQGHFDCFADMMNRPDPGEMASLERAATEQPGFGEEGPF